MENIHLHMYKEEPLIRIVEFGLSIHHKPGCC